MFINESGDEPPMNVQTISGLVWKGLGNATRRRPLNTSTEVRLTNLCTQRCRQCSIPSKSTGTVTMTMDEFTLVARRLREYGAYIGFISGGEPALVPHLEDILLEARKTFPLAVTLNTGLYTSRERIEPIARFVLAHHINIQTSMDGLGSLGDDLRGVPDFSATVLGHMEWIAALQTRMRSRSLLYANIVISRLNMSQIPAIVEAVVHRGWRVSIGMYHTLTDSTRADEELVPTPGPEIDRLLAYLVRHPQVLTLNGFLSGMKVYLEKKRFRKYCPYLLSPLLSTRLLVKENGDAYLCKGRPIGNLLQQELGDIFGGQPYRQRLEEYQACPGCWTSCYMQRYLILHPRSFRELVDNVTKVRRAKRGLHLRGAE